MLPLRFVWNGVGQQSGGLAGGATVAEADEIDKAAVILTRETAGIHSHGGVCQGKGAALVLQDHHVNGAGEHAGESFEFLAVAGRDAEIDGNDSVGIHFAHYFDGNVLDHAAIRQHAAIDHHGSENTRDRHAGTHGRGQGTVVQDHAVAALHVSGHAAERNGQVVEAGNA